VKVRVIEKARPEGGKGGLDLDFIAAVLIEKGVARAKYHTKKKTVNINDHSTSGENKYKGLPKGPARISLESLATQDKLRRKPPRYRKRGSGRRCRAG